MAARPHRVLFQLLVCSGFAAPLDARTWRVPADAPTIQAGIDSARAGDDVLLAPGTYTWTSEGATTALVRMKAGVRLHSEAGAAQTILDAETLGRVILCQDVGDQARIEGLTILNGRGAQGAGIQVMGISNPSIVGCVIQGNRCETPDGRGGGIFCDVASIEHCEFRDNLAGDSSGSGRGGAISCGAAQIQNCLFSDNHALGDASAAAGAIRSDSAIITNCSFELNSASAFLGATGGAIVDSGTPSISSCTFTSNRVSSVSNPSRGGAITIVDGTIAGCVFMKCEATGLSTVTLSYGGAVYSFGGPTMRNSVFIGCSAQSSGRGGFGGAIFSEAGGLVESCTLLGNSGGTAQGIGGIVMNQGGSIRSVILAYTTGQTCSGAATWSCSNLFGNSGGDLICGTDGGGNFSADPLFCAVDPISTGNVLIQQNSPCAPGHHPPGGESCGLIGAGSVGCTVAVERRSWSQIKALYR